MGLFRRKNPTPAEPPTPAGAAAGAASDPPVAEITTGSPTATDVAPVDAAAVDELRAELAALRQRLDASDRAKADLEATVEALNHRLIVTAPPPAPPTPIAPPPPVPIESSEAAALARHAETAATLEHLQRHVDLLHERIGVVDDRVTSVSTELANQLTEIGDEIEPIHDRAERLAAEQARYQIQFRQDLAELAERIRRPGPS